MKIIIVDDEPKIRNGLKSFLGNRADMEVVGIFDRADKALLSMPLLNPDVVITDIKMPGHSGLDLIEQIKRLDSKAVIIIISGYSDFQYAQRAIELGVHRYLTKPTNPMILMEILHDLAKHMKKENEKMPSDGNISKGGKKECELFVPNVVNNVLVRQAMHYIHLNYHEKIGLKEIAGELFITPNYLSDLFRKHMGINCSEYITFYRIQRAKQLLRASSHRITEISEMVGFSDAHYFSNVFKKLCKMTPNEYKNSVFITEEE